MTERERCRIYEYDGAFQCVVHDKLWGAVTEPDEPCHHLEPQPGGGWHRLAQQHDVPDLEKLAEKWEQIANEVVTGAASNAIYDCARELREALGMRGDG